MVLVFKFKYFFLCSRVTAKKTGSSVGENIPEGTITGFNKITINHDNVFDAANGSFTAPVNGTYLLMFESLVLKGELISLMN